MTRTARRYRLYGQLLAVPENQTGEILSSSTERKDRTINMPLYAQYAVDYAWLLDRLIKKLEAFRRTKTGWSNIGSNRDNDRVIIAPFDAISITPTDQRC